MTDSNFQRLIIKNLVLNDEYLREVLPFLKWEYFSFPYRDIYNIVNNFFNKFNERPTIDAIELQLYNNKKFSEKQQEELDRFFLELREDEPKFVAKNIQWLMEETEKFCRDSAIENAIRKSVQVITGEEKSISKDQLPDLLRDAISISFDRSIGHDYLEDYEKRYDYYTKKEEKFPFDIDYLNKITNGGIAKKTLNIFLGGVNVGKTLTLCHFAATYLRSLMNVLYITMEMSEEEITKRIDANLLDISIDTLKTYSREGYFNMIKNLKSTIPKGNLIVKEFPTAVPNVNHFRKLLLELKVKKEFVPHIIIIDYMNICSSTRIQAMNTDNSYMLVKAIAEELRGLAMEEQVPVITATQLNRTGFSSSDVDMTNIADSFGTAMTADLIVSLINNEKLEKTNTIIMKQLKNRYGDVTLNKRAYVGISRAKMKLFNVEQNINLEDSPEEMEEYNDLEKISQLFS